MTEALDINFFHRVDRGLAYAESCFETFRVIDGRIFHWPAHWSRLSKGLASFGLTLDESAAEPVLAACLHHAAVTAADCLLRLTATGGTAEWGLLKHGEVSFYIQATPYQTSSQNPELLVVSSPFPLLPKIAKFPADYSLTLRSLAEWQQQFPHASARQFLITKDKQVISGITANILILRHGQWYTPEGNGVLPGIVSSFLVARGKVLAQPCPESWLDDCESLLLTNCGQFIQPVASINGRALACDLPHIADLENLLKAEQGVSIEQD